MKNSKLAHFTLDHLFCTTKSFHLWKSIYPTVESGKDKQYSFHKVGTAADNEISVSVGVVIYYWEYS